MAGRLPVPLDTDKRTGPGGKRGDAARQGFGSVPVSMGAMSSAPLGVSMGSVVPSSRYLAGMRSTTCLLGRPPPGAAVSSRNIRGAVSNRVDHTCCLTASVRPFALQAPTPFSTGVHPAFGHAHWRTLPAASVITWTTALRWARYGPYATASLRPSGESAMLGVWFSVSFSGRESCETWAVPPGVTWTTSNVIGADSGRPQRDRGAIARRKRT